MKDERLSKEDALFILKAIKRKVNSLEKEIKSSMRKEGKCPHDRLVDATTFEEARKGFKVYRCLDCGKEVKKSLIREDYNESTH